MDVESRQRDAAKLVSKARMISQKRRSLRAGKAAFDLLSCAAVLGSAEADYAIGTWYLFGKYLPKDDAKAALHLQKAARKKHVSAMFDLAVLLETGRGVRKDKVRAFQQYVQAAKRLDLDAINSVGRCLFHGIGVTRSKDVGCIVLDYAKAVSTLQKKRGARPVRARGKFQFKPTRKV